MLVTPQVHFPRSAPIALGGTTDAVLLASLRGVLSARVTAGSVVLQLLRWLDGVGGWEIVRANGRPVAIRPSIFSADGVSAGEFSAGSGYYTALLTTAPPDGDLANLAAVDIADLGAGASTTIDAADVEYTPTDPGNWDAPPTDGQEAWDELASRVRNLENTPGTAQQIYTVAMGVTTLQLLYRSGSGTAALADASDPAKMPAIGFVASKPSATTAVLADEDELGGFVGLTPGAVYYADPATPGGITATQPVTAGQVAQPIGEAKSATVLTVRITGNPPVYL